MFEILALPGWNTEPTPLSRWVSELQSRDVKVVVTRESPGVSWLEVSSERLRGYVLMEGDHVEAINFELAAPDSGPARRLLEATAAALGWDLDDEQDLDEDDDT
jgi:hypothetical protein